MEKQTIAVTYKRQKNKNKRKIDTNEKETVHTKKPWGIPFFWFHFSIKTHFRTTLKWEGEPSGKQSIQKQICSGP